jgi:serine/threonine protein kinase
MAGFFQLFRCIGEAFCARGLRALADVVPLGGAVYEVAEYAWQRFNDLSRDEEVAQLAEAIARATPEEAKAQALAVAEEVAGDQPEAVKQRLAAYLAHVPAALRQSLRRPADPSGHTCPPSFRLGKPEDLLQLLPPRLPHFQAGDRPPGLGDWELVELLGLGGFGEVWKAKHAYFDGIPPAAVKFCLDETARDRLLRHEAAVLNQVMRQGRHPGIVPLQDASLSSSPPFLRYEFIEGGDLSGLVREWSEVLPKARWKPATEVLLALSRVIAFAHGLTPPIVHRDLKPANVLVQRQPEGGYALRVTDFGIGGVASKAAGSMLGSTLRGSHTPLYSSPEQSRGGPPDPRDDVHALGVIWYQMLTGDLAGTPSGLWTEELLEQGVPGEAVRLLGMCVAKPDRRPADAGELARRLEPLVPVKAAPAPPPPPPQTETRLERFLRTGQTGGLSYLLDLTGKAVGDEGAIALANCQKLAQLDALILSSCQVGDVGIKALAESPHLTNLKRLVLWDNRVSDVGVIALANCPRLETLDTLDLGRNRVGDQGVIALANSPHMRNLTALILVSNFIGDPGAIALAKSPHLARMAELKPLDNRITSAGVTALKEAFGKRVRVM